MIVVYSPLLKRVINKVYDAYHGIEKDGIPYICYLFNNIDDSYPENVMIVWFLNNITFNCLFCGSFF